MAIDYNTPEYAQYGYMDPEQYYKLFPNMRGKTYNPDLIIQTPSLTYEQLAIPGNVMQDIAVNYQAANPSAAVMPIPANLQEALKSQYNIPRTTKTPGVNQDNSGSGIAGVAVLVGLGLLLGRKSKRKARK